MLPPTRLRFNGLSAFSPAATSVNHAASSALPFSPLFLVDRSIDRSLFYNYNKVDFEFGRAPWVLLRFREESLLPHPRPHPWFRLYVVLLSYEGICWFAVLLLEREKNVASFIRLLLLFNQFFKLATSS